MLFRSALVLCQCVGMDEDAIARMRTAVEFARNETDAPIVVEFPRSPDGVCRRVALQPGWRLMLQCGYVIAGFIPRAVSSE